MPDELIQACHAHCPGVRDMLGVATLMRTLTPHVHRLSVADGDLPWGRYLLAQGDGFNLQLDIFSADYTGGIHAHGTWGIFWVIRGALWSESHTGDDAETLAGSAWVPVGGCQAFCPPVSDWHRVGTPAQGPQTVSLHLYGPGFDLDQGVALGPDGRPRTYRRGAWGDLSRVRGALV
jgi:hypothetical protein